MANPRGERSGGSRSRAQRMAIGSPPPRLRRDSSARVRDRARSSEMRSRSTPKEQPAPHHRPSLALLHWPSFTHLHWPSFSGPPSLDLRLAAGAEARARKPAAPQSKAPEEGAPREGAPKQGAPKEGLGGDGQAARPLSVHAAWRACEHTSPDPNPYPAPLVDARRVEDVRARQQPALLALLLRFGLGLGQG